MKKILILLVSYLAVTCCMPAAMQPPVAEQRPDTLYVLGNILVDNWSYLRSGDDYVMELITRENAYAREQMRPSRKLAGKLNREYLKRVDVTEDSYPYQEGGYSYFTRSIKGKAYPIYYRRQDQKDSPLEVVLDLNALAKGKAYFSLGIYAISPDQNWLAFSEDNLGDEIYTLHLKDLRTGRTKKTEITGIADFVWAGDSRRFLIVLQDDRYRSYACYQGDIEGSRVTLKLREDDPGYDLSMYKSCDQNMIFLLHYSKNQTEIRYLDASVPDGEFRLILPRRDDVIYYPDYLNGVFYLQTNADSPAYSIQFCPETEIGTGNWQTLIAGVDEEPVMSFQLFAGKLILLKRVGGFKAFYIYDLLTGLEQDWLIPEYPVDLHFWHNPDPAAEFFTCTMESDLKPYSIHSYYFDSGETRVLYEKPAFKGYRQNAYQSEIRYVEAGDGTMIPLRLIYSSSLDLKQTHPLWLYGYGAYGDCEDPYFSASRFSILDRGVIYAVAHVRGGGEFGDIWYQQGKLHNKQNSFSDFISCMDYLIREGLTEPAMLLIEGGSAGGLLVGAVVNQAWDKCRIVIADVPFVDVVNTMLDPSLPLTAQEYQEWGDPGKPADIDYMLSYSPYDNVRQVPYPDLLISAAWYDSRVGYWEALKWTQKLRSMNTSGSKIIFRLNWNEGHTGASDFYQGMKTYAETTAYGLSMIAPYLTK
ncbi:MAG: S9 family peptidase [Candidatus Cloacimonetes bacterium]|nr:S9 family peptidase [Candidatus Cloacimonadota bacterium]